MRKVATVFMAGIMAGCASMSENECRVADWRMVGYEDGARGRGGDAIGTHRRACAKANVTPDFSAYEEGRRDGLRQFCHPANGYQIGRGGVRYTGVCPADLEDEFLIAYREGHTIHRLESDVRAAEHDIRRIEKRIEKMEIDLEDAEIELVAEGVSTEERKRLLNDVQRFAHSLGALSNERDKLVHLLSIRRQRLQEQLDKESN